MAATARPAARAVACTRGRRRCSRLRAQPDGAALGRVADEVMMEALAECPGTDDTMALIYMRRGYRASDDGTAAVETGHYKVGRTSCTNAADRKTDGSMPTTSRPIAQWRVPLSRAAELEARVHAALAVFNIKLGHGREWFTLRKLIRADSELYDALAVHEELLLRMIDGCLLQRHEPIPLRTKRAANVTAEPPAPKRAATVALCDDLTGRMLAEWVPPINTPPQAMVLALRRAVKACEDPPPRMHGKASDDTAKSSRIALSIAAAFKRYTGWEGADLLQIRDDPLLKRHLKASSRVECRLFQAGSDCGAGSGSQALGWCAAVAKVTAVADGDCVVVKARIGADEYEWSAEWAARQ